MFKLNIFTLKLSEISKYVFTLQLKLFRSVFGSEGVSEEKF